MLLSLLCFVQLRKGYDPRRMKSNRVQIPVQLLIGAVLLTNVLNPHTQAFASALDQLTDLTGRASVTVTLTGRDNFNSEYRYDLTVRNRSSDLLIADSLVIVLEKITNLAGEEREPLKSEPILSRFDIVGQDGETDDGKPFFRVPVGVNPDLAPLTDSPPLTIRIRNKDYVSVFTPIFRVYGKKRPPAEPRQSITQAPPGSSTQDRQTEKLIQLLLKKGVITEEEWRKAMQP